MNNENTKSIYDIIKEINENNSTNYKKEILKKYKNNDLFKRVLKMTYDKVQYTYGITMKNVEFKPSNKKNGTLSLNMALDFLEKKLVTREITGNQAIFNLEGLFKDLSKENAEVLKLIIERDLKINIGKSIINKVHSGLITKPAYCRCETYREDTFNNDNILTKDEYDKLTKTKQRKFNFVNDKYVEVKKGTSKNISYPAIVQLKADGTYREFKVEDGNVICRSRSGESYQYPKLEERFKTLLDSVYIGELTVKLTDQLLKEILPKIKKDDLKNDTNFEKEITESFEKAKHLGETYILPRSIGNGLINSDNPPYDEIVMDCWDKVSLEEYKNAINKIPNKIPYKTRLEDLQNEFKKINDPNLNVIETYKVNNISEALHYTSLWMNKGLEGGILKNKDMVFKDGTSKDQLKLKVAFEVDVRIVGFIEGKKGTKRAKTFGSFKYKTDDGKISGRASGIPDKLLKKINNNRDEYLGKVITVEANDLTQNRKNKGTDFYSLSHPRYTELRDDKTTTDDLQRALESLESAKQVDKKKKLDPNLVKKEIDNLKITTNFSLLNILIPKINETINNHDDLTIYEVVSKNEKLNKFLEFSDFQFININNESSYFIEIDKTFQSTFQNFENKNEFLEYSQLKALNKLEIELKDFISRNKLNIDIPQQIKEIKSTSKNFKVENKEIER